MPTIIIKLIITKNNIVASPNVQDNFKSQLFNENNLNSLEINGLLEVALEQNFK